MREKIKGWWDYIQSLLDLDGDVWMGLFTAFILARIILVLKHYAPLSGAEATVYSAAIGAFSYSNKK